MTVVPESFCILPWIHAHVTPQGFRKLCAVDGKQVERIFERQGESLAQFWNGEEMRGVRREMLSGVLPERCALCSPDTNRAETYRDFALERWRERVIPSIAATEADGSIPLMPVTYDYRSSICNLKCRICSPRSSSAVEAEARRFRDLTMTNMDRWNRDYVTRRFEAWEISRAELLEAARNGSIEHLYWAGGEPFHDETHWAVMAELVRSGNAGKVDVAYNTNLMTLNHRHHSVEQMWPHFANVHVQASIDGVGKVGEYIRTGFKTSVFEANIEKLTKLAALQPSITVALDITLTSVGLLHLESVMRFALDHRLPATAKLMLPADRTRYMAVEYLPKAVKDDWCKRWMDWIAINDRDGMLDEVYKVLALALQKQSCSAEEVRAGASAIAAFEDVRRESGDFKLLVDHEPRLRGFPENSF